jgi:hypothetical protein
MPEADGAWIRVRDRAMGFDGPSILSHEVLGLSTDEHITRIVKSLEPARLHLVVMARSLATILPSVWQEKVKMVDPDVAWHDFLRAERRSGSPTTDASRILRRWLPHVPASRIHVVTVPPRESAPEELLHRLAAAIGFDVASWERSAEAMNESLDLVQAELIRRLNLATASYLGRRAQRRLVNDSLLPHIRKADLTRKLRIPVAERHWIEAETQRRIASLEASNAVIHGDLGELEARLADWDDKTQAVAEADLLTEALLLLAASHSDARPATGGTV